MLKYKGIVDRLYKDLALRYEATKYYASRGMHFYNLTALFSAFIFVWGTCGFMF